MFGSLRLPRSDDASRQLWRAHLCASCHAMREVGGHASALLTNYDQTLLALVLAGLAPPRSLELRACTALPWRRVAVQPLSPALRAFLAAGNLALIDAKLRDDVEDERGVTARVVLWLLRAKVERARARLQALGFPLSMVETLPVRQLLAERRGDAGLASLAAPSAELLAQVFVHGGLLAGAERTAELAQLGARIGSAVYVFDAIVDHAEDERRHRFNALAVVARRISLPAALQEAVRMLGDDVHSASGIANGLLAAKRAELVGSVLCHLEQRAVAAVARIEASRPRSSMRLAEAGDCDLPCDAGCCGAADESACCCDCCLPLGGKNKRYGEVIGRLPPPIDVGRARQAERDLRVLIGRKGRTLTIVETSGIVRVDGANYDAFTTGRYLQANTEVTVRDAENGRLRIEP